MNAMEILVIILSCFLVLFLIVGSILGIMLIRVTLQIRKVTSTAQKAAQNVESLASNISKATSGAYLSKLIVDQLKKFTKGDKHGKR